MGIKVNRRMFLRKLGVGGLILVSGCIKSGLKYTIFVDPTSKDDIPFNASLNLSEIEPEKEYIIEKAISKGTYRINDVSHLGPSDWGFQSVRNYDYRVYFGEGNLVRLNGSYYLINWKNLVEEGKSAYTLGLEDVSSWNGSVRDVDQLSSIDKTAIKKSYRLFLARKKNNGSLTDIDYRYVYGSLTNQSGLVPKSDHGYVRFQETVFRTDVRKQQAEKPIYRVKAEKTTEEEILNRLVFNFNELDLSKDEEKVFEKAINSGKYTEGWGDWDNLSEGFRSLLLRFESRQNDKFDEDNEITAYDPNAKSLAYVKFRDQYYAVRINVQTAE